MKMKTEHNTDIMDFDTIFDCDDYFLTYHTVHTGDVIIVG
jgi:hypothetical protein